MQHEAQQNAQAGRGGHLGANEPIVALKSPECGSTYTVCLVSMHVLYTYLQSVASTYKIIHISTLSVALRIVSCEQK